MNKAGSSARVLRVTLIHSALGCSSRHKATVRALGLRHVRQSVEQLDTPQLRGMVAKVAHLVTVEEVGIPAADSQAEK